MGMFDYLRCEYPLPDEAPVDGWQTKDTPNQVLEKYVITRDGRLVDSSGETLSDFHGDVEFYQFNLRRSGTGGHETADGLPPGGWPSSHDSQMVV